MRNIIFPLAQELNLNGIEVNGTVYTDLSGAIVYHFVLGTCLGFLVLPVSDSMKRL